MASESEGTDSVTFYTKDEFTYVAVSLQVFLEEEAYCRFETRMAGLNDGLNLRVRIMETAEHGMVSSNAASSTNNIHAHVEGVFDTKDDHEATGNESGWASGSIRGGVFSDWVRLSIVATSLAPWPDDVLESWPFDRPAPEHSLWLSAECDGPIEATLSGGQEVALLSPLHASTGAGVWIGGTASALVGGEAGGDFVAPDVRFRSGSLPLHAGIVSLAHPQGSETWALSPVSSSHLAFDGGPGEYTANLHRVGAGLDGFWSYLAGFHPIEEFEQIHALPRL